MSAHSLPINHTARLPARRWLREPLLHFVLIGALLFALSAWLHRDLRDLRGPAGTGQIVLSEDDLLQLLTVWQAQGRPAPNPAQMQELIEARIREEVLYREALAMGLDKNDTIVRRRMAQKMDFLAEDLSALREPGEDELRAWLASHPQEFAFPPRITFHHIFFAFDRHGPATRSAADAGLAAIAGQPAAAVTAGDPFMFQDIYAERTPDQVGSVFGGKFSRALFELKPGTWTGPVESGFGWHLIFIDTLTPGRVPQFEEVAAEVKAAWQADQRAGFKREAYAVMRAKYEVILPGPAETPTRLSAVTGTDANVQ